MAVQVLQMFPPTVLTTSAATLYTSSGLSSSITQQGRIRFTNTSGAVVSVTAYAVPTGGTAGVGNCFCDAEAVPAGKSLDIDVPSLIFGQFVQALASANTSVTVQAMAGVLFI